ncbi:glyoxylase-like metal-dependent hydrolase (beta-lactamase superfamily II) [Streptomyces sp. SAI-135]|jgi:glyoxylase-like metal-dependent hydrolase (beta-lactamase superfamily II)|uniref:MBL fold metallo-hydrolase n=1 Tax=unclassified Streptomyces TaxID=2593676 RepID=UPI0024768500|nr:MULTISPECIES: MBL fold metallo-hydrolase [unclassified Streptomyces]MDH6522016.1 glyoxylase-like metal-dependent hydrolase (beta-lactamase superfamily II) [Streptomyces sp. SAI-090]MDH6573385.1 glyoxylase-like metal-dependent hydrolase (beta-lactamase superfamily II) [Streptomyces sp. SAI-117]MDH6613881.1 glyoxylase-like metal-dependent hydrolase (beta-lactamase superfamily II) [Streptomyces sp. SAI-135]
MSTLGHSVYVSASKPVVSDDLPPGETRRMWSPTASTLIHGKRDAVLVDPLMTLEESRALADWVEASGKNLTTIYVTHAHGDHFFGAPVLLDRFPGARLVATAGVAARMEVQYGRRWFHGFWDPRFPGQIASRRVTAEPLGDGNVIELEGHLLRAFDLGHTDTDGSSALHVPSSGLTVAGDAVYGDVHLYLAESQSGGRQHWLDALDTLERLQPTAVVSGHKRDGDPDSPEDIERTRRYIHQFDAAAKKARSHLDLYESMISLYPDRINRGVLWNSAKAVMA